MEYTRRRVCFTARERTDGQWRLAVWIDDPRLDESPDAITSHAWKVTPLSFEHPTWVMLALTGEARRYLLAISENEAQQQPDELDLWGSV